MSDSDLEARLDAVERTLTDGDADLDDAGAVAADLQRLEERVADLEATVADLDAAVQAVRGYAGNVRAVNRDVERRASAALAKAETLETTLEDGETADASAGPPSNGDRRAHERDASETDRLAAGRGESRDRSRRDGDGPPRWGDAFDERSPTDRQPNAGRPRRERRGEGDDATDDWPPAGETLSGDEPVDSRRTNGDDAGEQSRQTVQFVERVRDVL